jgi:hypothetical protein
MQRVLEISTQVAAGLAYLHATPAAGLLTRGKLQQEHRDTSAEPGGSGEITQHHPASPASLASVGSRNGSKTQRIVHRGTFYGCLAENDNCWYAALATTPAEPA